MGQNEINNDYENNNEIKKGSGGCKYIILRTHKLYWSQNKMNVSNVYGTT